MFDQSIFEGLGEARFREIEAKVLEELCSKERCVISTGGGAVLSPSNRTLLKERCICIYLRSNPEELIRRLRNDRKRPLLQVEDPLGVLRELFLQRDQLYEEAASFVVDTGRPSVHAVVNTISRHLDSCLWGF
ncbi:MAG: shikimate kinase [Burkholderiaceae bacterium]